MYIEHLSAFHFRNLKKLDVALEPRLVVMRGDNGQGKTNLLEALYVCATGRSFRTTSARELVTHGEERAGIQAVFVRQGVRHQIEITLDNGRRRIAVDGRYLKQLSRLLEVINVVAFFPDDLRIVKGSPEERRRFFDRAIANYDAAFVNAAVAYQKVLKQRNALLRTPGSFDKNLIAVLDEQLMQYGDVIQSARQRYIDEVMPAVQKQFNAIMGEGRAIGLRLLSGVRDENGGAFRDNFAKALRENIARDRARGMTLSGPHRADILIEVNGAAGRQFASQGQQRGAVLAMKLAEVAFLRERMGFAPIVLLDDISSEFDRQRNRMLMTRIGELESQVWLSTTGLVELDYPAATQVFNVQNGVLSAEKAGSEY